ncbi:reverse transcriptase domain-containing protein [Tanacetum coccineum]
MGLVPMRHLNHNFKNKEKLKAINTVVKPKSYIAQLDGSFSINVNAKELLSEKMKPKIKDDLEQGLLNKKLKILNDGMNIVKVSELFLSIDITDKIALLVKISVYVDDVQRITQSFSPNPEISFLPLDEEEGTEGPMIIEAEVGCHFIHRQISLLVKIGDEEHSTSAWMNFLIVRSSSPYNGIIGRPRIIKIQAVPSTTHGMLKFPVAGGILTLRSSKIIPIECVAVSKIAEQSSAISQAVEERIKVAIHPKYPEQTIMIGSTLTEEGRSKLCDLLRRNLDVFAWKPANMTGVPRHIAEHRLNVREGCPRSGKRKEVRQWTGTRQFNKRGNILASGRQGISQADWQEPGGRNVLRVQSQYQRNKGMPGQSRHGSKSSIPKMFEGCAKAKWKVGKLKQTEEAKSAFKQMKQHIAKLPMLTTPKEKEELVVYLAAAKEAGQILADFIVERPEDSPIEVEEELSEPWILFTDGSSCVDGSGAGLILINPKGMEFTYSLRFRFEATNNEARYEALIAVLRIAEQMGVKNLQANVDSRLVANQVNGTYIAKEADMIQYLEKVKTLTNGFRMFSIKQVPRSENKKADALRKIASTSFAHLSKQVLVEELKEKSINERKCWQ